MVQGGKTKYTPVSIAGVSMTEVTKLKEKTIKEIAFDVFNNALKDAGITKDDIDGLYVTPQISLDLPLLCLHAKLQIISS